MKNKEKSLMARKKRKIVIQLLWWSLLVHLAFLIFVFFFAFKKSTIFVPLKKYKLKKKELPAALKPRRSAFGSTVFFDNTATFKPPKALILGPKKLAGKIIPPVQKTKITPKPEPKLQVKKETKIKIKPKTQIIQVKVKEKPKIAKDSKIKKQIKEIEKKQKQVEQARIARAKLEQQVSIPKMQKIKGSYHQKQALDFTPAVKPRKRSIISMTKGFIENLKNEGNDWIKQKGHNKRPSFEELKYISYHTTVRYQIQSSFKIFLQDLLSQPNPTFVLEKILGEILLDFKIQKNGSIKTLKILESSGNKVVDQAIIKIIKDSAPFPPIPKHLQTSIIDLSGFWRIYKQKL